MRHVVLHAVRFVHAMACTYDATVCSLQGHAMVWPHRIAGPNNFHVCLKAANLLFFGCPLMPRVKLVRNAQLNFMLKEPVRVVGPL